MPNTNERDALYRKKPVVISATQFTKAMAEGIDALPPGVVFSNRNLAADGRFPEYANNGKYLTNYSTCHRHYIPTLEGQMDVQIGDWIITGVQGEHSPCKPDIFAETYELAATAPNADALLRQALAALEHHLEQTRPIDRTTTAISALRAHLAAPAQQAGAPLYDEIEQSVLAEASEIANVHPSKDAKAFAHAVISMLASRAPLPLAPSSATGTKDWTAINTLIAQYVEDYEMIGESDAGEACYTPNANERALILDAVHGLLAEPELIAALAAPPQATLPASEAVNVNGEPATALSLLEALIDIYDDAQTAAPEDRCYVEGAWPDVLDCARKFIATRAQPQADAAEPVVLTDEEIRFFKLVCAYPGSKLSSGAAFGEENAEGRTPALWEKLESEGLIECVGSYKWKPTFDATDLGIKARLAQAPSAAKKEGQP